MKLTSKQFDEVLSIAKIDEEVLGELIGYTAHTKNVNLDFYAYADDNFTVASDSCIYNYKTKKWEDLELTNEQMEVLQNKINTKLNELEANAEREENYQNELQWEADQLDSDPYTFYGVKPTYFI